MKTKNKLKILADAAKYDASCASSGAKRSRKKGELGDSNGVGICHSYTPDGRCVSLLKVLLTNYCIYDCLYCVNRVSSDIPRARFTTNEIVDLTLGFYKRNYIEGLFLSSGILKSPDYTATLLIDVAKRLRLNEEFSGYVHLKVAPGTSQDLIDEMSCWCDRISVNIELPTEKGLDKLAPAKNHKDVQSTMGNLKSSLFKRGKERKYNSKKSSLSRFGARSQSTQMIVGATPASDLDILKKSSLLYSEYNLSRVYYSGFSPIPHSDPIVPVKAAPLVREHRLYQADWLQRFYNFEVSELLDVSSPSLDLEIDPKLAWALKNRHYFPVDINQAGRDLLLRVPGFGVRTVSRILKARRFKKLDLGHLKQMRVPLKNSKYFIECNNSNRSLKFLDTSSLRSRIVPKKIEQLSLDFSAVTQTSFNSAVSGEL